MVEFKRIDKEDPLLTFQVDCVNVQTNRWFSSRITRIHQSLILPFISCFMIKRIKILLNIVNNSLINIFTRQNKPRTLKEDTFHCKIWKCVVESIYANTCSQGVPFLFASITYQRDSINGGMFYPVNSERNHTHTMIWL